ncbi:carbohydrate-binding protein [Dyadobacter sandarakinus]|uniref:Carbohydrate-binding protein n=1 Tax=Dyadobacter sandarakinus TaxID=2747268 RepID=A0ABX7IAM2_9BACT|nr:carbohydrate-binding protein [Dyadobacter sandarakinus]QRR02178.1 carbohydrate-binding protein [Dyadobacter sandarakinus]
MKIYISLFLLVVSFLTQAQSNKTIPGKIQAENFDAVYGVGTEDTQDEGGGQDIGWIGDGSWMDYHVQVTKSGYYTFRFRIANGFSPEATIVLKSAVGSELGRVTLPQTGGMQGWQTATMIAPLPAGSQTIRIFAEKGIFSFNWFECSGSKSIAGLIQAEHFDNMSGVRIEETGDTGGGGNLGYIDDNDWMDYNLQVTAAGNYTASFRISNAYGQGIIELRDVQGNVLGEVNVPQTGGWQSWNTISTQVTLPAGSQVVRVFARSGAFNFNWFELVPQNAQPVTENTLPGKVEAENFGDMLNMAAEATEDTGGGQNLRWIEDSSWADYPVQVAAAGVYTFNFRIANGFSPDARLSLKNAEGNVLASISLPQTGGMQGWKTIPVLASLPAGNQTLRVFADKGIFSLNWWSASASRPFLGKMEAEHFDVAGDIRTEETGDTDGGLNVSYIDDNDWLDYNVNIASAGLYTVNFRVSNSYGNGNIELQTASGSVLASVDVPQTGGWQNWRTIRTTAQLTAGSQVLRIHAKRGSFNLNWFEIIPGSVLGQAAITFNEIGARTTADDPFDLTASSNHSESPITFSSSNPSVISVSNATGSWKATVAGPGQATITASQAATFNFNAAESVSRTVTVTAVTNTGLGERIPIDSKRWYQLTNAANGLEGLFDGLTQENVLTGWGKVIDYYDAYYPLKDGESMTLESIKMFDFTGSTIDQPMIISIINDQWQKVEIGRFTGEVYNGWVGPYPGRNLSGNAQFRLDAPISNARYIVLTIPHTLPTEIEFYGSYTAPPAITKTARTKNIRLKDMLGVNGYEWNFQDGAHTELLVESKVQAAKSFTGLRHYMDWEKLESTEGVFSYNPTLSGSWNYDLIYERCKAENIEVLACLKTQPNWMQNTYPEGMRDAENVPVRYGADFTQPASYVEQARVAFQYVARYGSNKNVDPSLLSVSTTPRWYGDYANTIKIGLDLIKYIECDNERDKWWKARKGYQTAREYAANMSAFYDGHKNTMGPAVGVKNADPNMKVVIAGLVTGPDFIKGMVDWCKEFRGYNADGTVNLCWDIVNFHLYTDNASSSQSGTSTRGAAPEVTNAGTIMDNFVKVTREYSNDLPLWITEAGYDINESSPLKAVAIGDKSAVQVQADWILRTSLFAARHGIEKLFFYQMYDDNPLAGMFGSSGFLNDDQTRRPAADYFVQTNKLFGEYVYKETIHSDPMVDRYELNGKSLYIIAVPDETGRTKSYTLNLGGAGSARIYTPRIGSNDMSFTDVPVENGSITLTATESPVFVTGIEGQNLRQAAVEATPLLNKEAVPVMGEDVRVFPNPIVDYLNIELQNENMAHVDIKIFDSASGRLHKTVQVKKTGSSLSHQFNVAHLPAGVYIVEIRQGEQRAFRKIAKGY